MMRLISIITFFLMFGTTLLSQTSVDWNEHIHQFGNVKVGEHLFFNFEFKNVSEIPIIINDVKPSCGCTSFDYTKKPILSGETGFVKVEFSPKSTGPFYKNVSVYFENLDPQLLYINGVAEEKL